MNNLHVRRRILGVIRRYFRIVACIQLSGAVIQSQSSSFEAGANVF